MLLLLKRINGENKLLTSKTVQTKLLPLTKEQKEVNSLSIKPVLSIKGYTSGKIPLSIIKSATRFDINPPFKLISATVYISSTVGTPCVLTLALNGNVFNENFLKAWSKINPTTAITLDNIKLTDQDGKSFSIPVSFIVTED